MQLKTDTVILTCLFSDEYKSLKKKNAAKRSRQHAGKRNWEYVQRQVCFVNEQVP